MKNRDKVVLVTGAGGSEAGAGIGESIAIELAKEGYNLVLMDISAERLSYTEKRVQAKSAGENWVRTFAVDLTSEEDVCSVFEYLDTMDFTLTGVVNSMGITGPPGDVLQVDLSEWRRLFDINVTSILLVSRFAVPRMKNGGSIVNMSSVAGIQGGHHAIAYPTTKGAIISMTKAMAAHHGSDNIRVNVVSPGLVYTPMVARRGLSDVQRENRKNASLLKTEGTALDVANAVSFLVSDKASWITGQNLVVDGGLTAGMSQLPVPPSERNNDEH